MTAPEQRLAEATIRDLVRACWVIEQARASVYRTWSETDGRYGSSADRAARRAAVVEEALAPAEGQTDPSLVEPHAAWIRNLVGDAPGEVPLGNMLIARLGDWVEAHGAGFFGEEGARRMAELGEEERSSLAFPDTLPPAPPFEPLPSPEVDPPGEVRFRFGILGDLHIGSPLGRTMAAEAVQDLNRSGAELIVQLGDLTESGGKEEFRAAGEVLAALEMPWLTMMGNHDVLERANGELNGSGYFRATFGREPEGTSIEHKGVRFTVLDSVQHAASPFPPYNLTTGTFVEGRAGAIVCGGLSHRQHDLLAEVAAPGAGPAFVFLHHPPQPFPGFPPILFGLREEDSGRLHAAVDSGNVWGVFAGHTHRNALTRRYGSVPVMEVGIPRDYPFGYALVDVTEDGYAYRFHQISNEELLRRAHANVTLIHRRYGRGSDEERAFAWRPPGPQAEPR